MALNYQLLESARDEIAHIAKYLATVSGPTAAKAFALNLESLILVVCENPEAFRLSRMQELAMLGYRAAIFDTYVLLYSVRKNKVIVAHVFHQRQDYARLV